MEIIKEFEPLFGEWHAESFIGAGSYGRVYKAYKEEFGVRYYSAIKYISIPSDENEISALRDDNMSDESITSYYRELAKDVVGEASLMNQLKGYSNIVSYEDSKVLPKKSGFGYDIFIRMELLESLAKRARRAPITKADTVALGMDICTALDVCEERGIIHRDIKPDNIFLNAHGNYKLGDFGIARRLEKAESFMSKKGTNDYMAPEVYRGDKYGSACDIYSLGIVMYRLLNGNRMPFINVEPTKITPTIKEAALQRRMSGEPMPAPSEADPKLAGIVLKACAYNPSDRFASAKQMFDALKAYNESASASSASDPDSTVMASGIKAPTGRQSLDATTGAYAVGQGNQAAPVQLQSDRQNLQQLRRAGCGENRVIADIAGQRYQQKRG